MEEKKIPVWDLIRKRFPANEYAVLQEVRDNAGFNASRSADGIAMNLWPSRGLSVNGIELKSFRGDWLSEFKNPKKAEAIYKYCDYFWLVAANDKVVLDVGEIPATWGYLLAKGSKLITIKEAPKLTPESLSRGFIASLLKRATKDLIHPSSIEEVVASAVKTAVEKEDRDRDYRRKNMEDEFNLLKQKVYEFEQASGIRLTERYGSSGTKIGEAVKLVLAGGVEIYEKRLTEMVEVAGRIQNSISVSLEKLKIENAIPTSQTHS